MIKVVKVVMLSLDFMGHRPCFNISEVDLKIINFFIYILAKEIITYKRVKLVFWKIFLFKMKQYE